MKKSSWNCVEVTLSRFVREFRQVSGSGYGEVGVGYVKVEDLGVMEEGEELSRVGGPEVGVTGSDVGGNEG